MKIFISNKMNSLRVCLNIFRWAGFIVPDELTRLGKNIVSFYASFWIMFTVGIYIIVQSVALIKMWGDLTKTTSILFLLMMNLAIFIKMMTMRVRGEEIQVIIDEGEVALRGEMREEGREIVSSTNRETTVIYWLHALFAFVTTIGWAASAEKNALPLIAWYPYDTSKSPAYELTYFHQCSAVILTATLNVSYDIMLISLIAVCRCRFKLLALSLKTLSQDIRITNKLLTPEQEKTVFENLHVCIKQHQATLESAAQIQSCFNWSILGQLTVSTMIICVTAYQLTFAGGGNLIRLISMLSYLMGLMYEVYIYCYQGTHLSEDSSEISDAAYECGWYGCSVRFRRALLVLMVRSYRVTQLTAGGLATVSLQCFMAIIKASYSLFTVLQQVNEN